MHGLLLWIRNDAVDRIFAGRMFWHYTFPPGTPCRCADHALIRRIDELLAR